MATCFRRFSWIAPLAIVVLLTSQSFVFAQKSWNADQLASPFPGPQTEKELIEQLRSGAPEQKAIACKQLAIHGTKAAVPELAKLLSDEQLSSWSRIALEAIPDPAADAALVETAKTLNGKLLVGVINSIGVRRSEGAFDVLSDRLNGSDEEVASASAVALGNIGGDRAVHALHQAYGDASPAVRAAIAEGGILCAERLLAEGNNDRAAAIYELVRQADVPRQKILEATRGAIIARGVDGLPLLVEQLKSADRKRFAMALTTARQLPGREVSDALSAELATAKPERAALIVIALGDRGETKLPPAVLQAAKSGDKQVRQAALQVVGRLGDASAVPVLLETAADDDEGLSLAAKAALGGLPGEEVNAELARRLPEAKGKLLAVLIELAGERRMNVAPELVKVLRNGDESMRNAALVALGATASPKEVAVLISEVANAKNAADAELAERALQTACIRMPDREATAAALATALPNVSTATKARLLRILGAMGGPKALATISAAVKSGNSELQDAGTRALGAWMTVDAAPVLLEITKSSAPDKYRVRALRGYLRLARQLKMSDAERLQMCRQALAVAERDEERELVLDALKRCPSAESVELASSMLDDATIRDRAVEVAIFLGEKLKDKDPAAAKSAGENALKAAPEGKFADRARALTNKP
jgi:HEAT repeat protein